MTSLNKIIVFVPIYSPKNFHFEIYKSILKRGLSLFLQINSSLSKNNNLKLCELKLLGATVNNENKNIGISRALNFLITENQNKFSHLFFLDQDTFLNVKLFVVFLEKETSLINKYSLVNVNNNPKNSQIFITNSGSLINLNKIKFKFNDKYFVELIDYWLVVEIYERKLSIFKTKVDFLNHEIFQEKMNTFYNYQYKNYSNRRYLEILKNTNLLIFQVFLSKKLDYKIKYIFLKTLSINLISISLQFLITKINLKK